MREPAPTAAALRQAIAQVLPPAQVVTDPLRLVAWGGDASFYRLVPKVVAVVDNERELLAVLATCRRLHAPVTFRAAGTSLSGQSISDSVLVVMGGGWNAHALAADASTIRLQPGLSGSQANRLLAPYGRKIGPDPASIDAARIGGIAANNASGMCCGTRQNSYHTLAGMRVVLADGAVLDTEDAASVQAFRASHAELLIGLAALHRRVHDDPALAARIAHKYRMKNTTGYGLNALLDFADPIEMLTHLMIGSEGTLGFIAAITYRTVPDHTDKATALLLFDHLETACEAVTALKPAPVDAVELMDRAALASVQHQPGLPAELQTLGPDAAALLIDTRGADAAALQANIDAIGAVLAPIALHGALHFTRDPAEIARLWKVRKGTFPSVGAMRATGTTVIIEDVAFPVDRLAEATLDLQRLLRAHGYTEAIIFGHALEGNLHFVFTQDFATTAEVDRYAGFMDALAQLVVGQYDGALKAEHGTGRNMAPYVALEWGAEGLALMHEIKRLFDPQGLLNPGVILNADAQAHLKDLKPLPAADPIVDKCIECGFCEPKCPSAGLTLSPRQRIVGWREIARLEAAGSAAAAAELRTLYDYAGLETCAACGLCATACPVGIETGKLVKALRGRANGATAQKVAGGIARQYGKVTAGMRAGLAAADALHAVIGTGAMEALTGTARKLSGNRIPLWSAAMPRAGHTRITAPAARASSGDCLVYLPSCASRSMGPPRGDDSEDLTAVTQRVLERAGYTVIVPQRLGETCCGQPFESKGLDAAADAKTTELEALLLTASDNGRWPVVCDTSPCVYRMRHHGSGKLNFFDITEFLLDRVLPRVRVTPLAGTVAVHPVCSIVKQGLAPKLKALAQRCVEQVVMPDDVGCCAFAGDRGFTFPELNAWALRDLKRELPAGCREGYSTSRTCEIGLTEHGGIRYRSIVYLVDQCTVAVEKHAAAAAAS